MKLRVDDIVIVIKDYSNKSVLNKMGKIIGIDDYTGDVIGVCFFDTIEEGHDGLYWGNGYKYGTCWNFPCDYSYFKKIKTNKK